MIPAQRDTGEAAQPTGEVWAHLVDWQTHLRINRPDARQARVLSLAMAEIVTDYATCGQRTAPARLVELAVHGATAVAAAVTASTAGGEPLALSGGCIDMTVFPSPGRAELTVDGADPHATATLRAITACLNDEPGEAHAVLLGFWDCCGLSALSDVLVDLAALAAGLHPSGLAR